MFAESQSICAGQYRRLVVRHVPADGLLELALQGRGDTAT